MSSFLHSWSYPAYPAPPASKPAEKTVNPAEDARNAEVAESAERRALVMIVLPPTAAVIAVMEEIIVEATGKRAGAREWFYLLEMVSNSYPREQGGNRQLQLHQFSTTFPLHWPSLRLVSSHRSLLHCLKLQWTGKREENARGKEIVNMESENYPPSAEETNESKHCNCSIGHCRRGVRKYIEGSIAHLKI